MEWRGKPQTCHRKISPQTGVSKLPVNVIMVAFSVRAKFPFPPNTLFAMATILLPILLCPVYAANLPHFKKISDCGDFVALNCRKPARPDS